jgi:hypothetical protein
VLPRALVASSALLLAACGPDIAYQSDSSMAIPAGATWSFGAADTVPMVAGLSATDTIARVAAAAIASELDRAGFPHVHPDSAQFVVRFDVAPDGLIAVDVARAGDSTVAWRGTIASGITAARARPTIPALREAIRRLMKGFP